MSFTVWTVANFERMHRRAGGHFFDHDTMRFFASRICAGGVLFGDRAFVTSEKSGFDDYTRTYTVRVVDVADPRGVDTFERFASLATAEKWARTVGNMSPEQWETAQVFVSDGIEPRAAVRAAVALLPEAVAE